MTDTVIARAMSALPFDGTGYIAGTASAGVTVNSVPSAREVECRDRMTRETLSVVFSASTGEYLCAGLDPSRKYDVIARDWQGVYNDVIRSGVVPASVASPALAPPNRTLVLGISGGVSVIKLPQFTAATIQITAQFGTPPYTFSGTGLPACLTVSSAGVLSYDGTALSPQSVTLSVTDSSSTPQTYSKSYSVITT